METLRINFWNNLNDCNNHLTITDLISAFEDLSLKVFDSLKDEKFEDLGFEILLNEMSNDKHKADKQKCFEFSVTYGTNHGFKSLSL